MKSLLIALLLLSPALAQEPPTDAADSPAGVADRPTAEDLLDRIDDQLRYESRTSEVAMEVVNPRRTRTFEMKTWGRGLDQAAIEYLAPAREKGTRMLRRGDELWMYLPRIERVQKISGHMLRQGMMGSDVSYEDMMNNLDWSEQYTAEVAGESEVDGRPCWRVEMTATDDSVTYAKRITCVDKETSIPLQQELYAVSGMLLKTWTMSDIRKHEASGRWVAHQMRIEDELQEGTHTTIRLEDVSFGVEVPDEVFSTRWLERG